MASKPPYEIIKDFEHAIGEYTGSPFVTCVNSCTMALRLCLDWKERQRQIKGDPINIVEIPKRTYVSVPIQIKKAGYRVEFTDREWEGIYELYPLSVYDSARRFTSGMFSTQYLHEPTYMCVSFHYTKILGLGHGGAILHDDPDAAHFFREMRHDGRVDGMPIDSKHIQYLGHHCPMSPEIAAQGLVRLSNLPRRNKDLPNSNYPDLSTFKVFK